ncbi:MAG: hypothetical protein P9E24_10970 [Candidatus Competibacter sp.]|nr:hypothetical protein [Candidatus Competibacter sp.]MDG4585803.1 hypothetical protein [Candidatus Competibacter sp.]
MMVLCAVLSGVEDWVGMEAFAEEKATWLRGLADEPVCVDGKAIRGSRDGVNPAVHKDHSAENLALIRRMALNVPRHNGPPRDSIRHRKLRAAFNDDYRLRRLLGQSNPATA